MRRVGEDLASILSSPGCVRVAGTAAVELSSPVRIPAEWIQRQWIEDADKLGEFCNQEGSEHWLKGIVLPVLVPVLDAWRPVSPNNSCLILAGTDLDESHAKSRVDTIGMVKVLSLVVERCFGVGKIEILPLQQGDAFRFSDVRIFLQASLVPLLERMESEAKDNKTAFDLSLSLSTGTIPMVWSLSAMTRRYRPTLLHVPDAFNQPSDQRCHSVDVVGAAALEQWPPEPLAQRTETWLRLAVDEMVKFAKAYQVLLEGKANEHPRKNSFWLRQSGKPVLAVVVVRDSEGGLRAYRGCNMEVSLPTGSLCAERSAIAQALADNPSLERSHVLAVAVLSMAGMAFLEPCGVCSEWLLKVAEENPSLRLVLFEDASCERAIVRPF